MGGNEPCRGCWWAEGGRCFNDRLADIHGLEKAPRNGWWGGKISGLERTDAHLTACLDRGFRKSRIPVLGRVFSELRASGVEVVHLSSARIEKEASHD